MSQPTRREVVRSLSAAAALPLVSRFTEQDIRRVGTEAGARLAGDPDYVPRTLTSAQRELVARMADIIIPPTDTPGAADVGVQDFVDVIVTDWYYDEERDAFLGGLAAVDDNATQQFTNPFLECTESQQEQLVREMDAAMGVSIARGEDLSRNFYAEFKRLTLTGYYTSQPGMMQELGWNPIPGAYRACEPVEDLRRG